MLNSAFRGSGRTEPDTLSDWTATILWHVLGVYSHCDRGLSSPNPTANLVSVRERIKASSRLHMVSLRCVLSKHSVFYFSHR